jgi:cyclophilin family peptidyl-prolyl cis-trans isomerase
MYLHARAPSLTSPLLPAPCPQFLDLVQRRFYDGMDIQRADGFVVQTGDPDGPATGFVDDSGNVRT